MDPESLERNVNSPLIGTPQQRGLTVRSRRVAAGTSHEHDPRTVAALEAHGSVISSQTDCLLGCLWAPSALAGFDSAALVA